MYILYIYILYINIYLYIGLIVTNIKCIVLLRSVYMPIYGVITYIAYTHKAIDYVRNY